MCEAKSTQMKVELYGSDDPYFLPPNTEVGAVFDVGPEQYVLEERTMAFDSANSPAFSVTGRARQVVRAR